MLSSCSMKWQGRGEARRARVFPHDQGLVQAARCRHGSPGARGDDGGRLQAMGLDIDIQFCGGYAREGRKDGGGTKGEGSDVAGCWKEDGCGSRDNINAEGMTDKAYELCRQMIEQGLLSSRHGFNLVIKGLLRDKRWEDAIGLFEVMVDIPYAGTAAKWEELDIMTECVAQYNLVATASSDFHPEFMSLFVKIFGGSVAESSKRVLFLSWGYMEEYEVLIPFQFLQIRESQVNDVCQDMGVGDKCLAAIHDFGDVRGVDEAKEELVEVVSCLHGSLNSKKLGAKLPRGCLLVGPPGTGNTLLARAIAGKAGIPFFYVSASEFVQAFVGRGVARVRELFKEAKEAAPSIIFIDDLDAVGGNRGRSFNHERDQTLNQLITEMDGFDSNMKVIAMASTNRPKALDAALCWPGHFSKKVRSWRLGTFTLGVSGLQLGPYMRRQWDPGITNGQLVMSREELALQIAVLLGDKQHFVGAVM
jgi:pentatricopeptide repeat protein